MQVGTATTTSANTAEAPARTQSSSLDYDAFLQLLIAQMKNQDPTQPMDSAEYMGQLASFSNVEQGINMNARLDALLTAQALTQADGIIGRTLTSADGEISGKVTAVRIVSGGAVAVLDNDVQMLLGPGVTVT